MDMVVILEFRKRKQLGPVVLSLVDKETKVLLQFLVYPLCLTIPLWVVSCGSRQFNSENSIEFPSEFRNELGASIGHYLPRQPMVPPDVLEEEPCGSSCSNSGECRGKVSSLSDRVHYHHYRVMTRRLREFHYEVHTDCLPGCGRYRERVEFSDWEVPLSLRAKAEITGGDVLPYVSGHLWPPIIAGYQL